MTTAQLCSSIGLVADIIGACYLTAGVIVSKEAARSLGAAYWSSDDPAEQDKLPMVQELNKNSRRAKMGLAFLVAGFLGQLTGTLLSSAR